MCVRIEYSIKMMTDQCNRKMVNKETHLLYCDRIILRVCVNCVHRREACARLLACFRVVIGRSVTRCSVFFRVRIILVLELPAVFPTHD
jgi:hypothetical protein